MSSFTRGLLFEDFSALNLRDGGPTDAGYTSGRGRWTPRYHFVWDAEGTSNRGNKEWQFYADPAFAWAESFTPFAIVDGKLRIRAQETPEAIVAQMPNRFEGTTDTGIPYPYVSGILTTKHSFAVKAPALLEARIKVPKGQAVWPAFWALNQAGGHPPEIDVMEYNGMLPTKNAVGQFQGTNGNLIWHRTVTKDLGVDLSDAFHTYGVAWSDDGLYFYVDGTPIAYQPSHPSMNDAYFYVILNVAIGGGFVGNPTEETPSQSDMLVGWVRIKGRPETQYLNTP